MAKKKAARKAPAKSKARTKKATAKTKKKPRPGEYNPAFDGWITHTELISVDAKATGAWAAKVLGWKFRPSFPMPDGSDYLLFVYADQGGGGIRRINSPEVPGALPYVQVANVKKTYEKALQAGGEEIMAPAPVKEDLVIAIVRAPGGVPIGLAGPK